MYSFARACACARLYHMYLSLQVPPALMSPNKRSTMKLLAGWLAIGIAGCTITTSALGACLLVPFLGWFIGIPMILMAASLGAILWLMVFLCLLPAGLFQRS